MAGASDIRDIMELSAPSDAPRPAKRSQQAAPAPRLTGMSREVYALMGDRAPPIPLGDQMPKYKSKPKYQQKDWRPRKWEPRAFVNGARKDGLVLRHWKLTNPVANGESISINGTTATGDIAMGGGEGAGMVVKTSEDGQQVTTRYSDEFPMEKFNVKAPVPKYTDEQYNAHLKSDTWTREETDHLMELCRDYDLRWFVIADRWNYDPDEDKSAVNGTGSATDGVTSTELKKPKWPPERSMEQLKSRYYVVAAAMLAIARPPSDMLPSEYALWEKMQKFDAATETQRKKLAEALFSRSEDEAMEEKLLLAELKRIVDYEDQFLAERRDIYARLESVPSHRREGDQNTSSSAYLSALLQNLLAKEKRGKVIRAPDPAAAAATATATAPPPPAEPQRTQSWEKGSHPNQYTRRNTNAEDTDSGPQKKGQAAVNIRKLTPAEEAKYGVTHHDRLTSGVSFRHEKVIKLTQAKSQAQTLKLQSALTELKIPPRLVMPTEKVCREFERLIQKVNLLLDVRKLSEKVKSEVDVLEQARRTRLGIPKEPKEGEDMDVDKKESTDQNDESKEAKSTEAGETQPKTEPTDGDEPKTEETKAEADSSNKEEEDDNTNDNQAEGETAADVEAEAENEEEEADADADDDAEADEEDEIEESKVDLDNDEEDEDEEAEQEQDQELEQEDEDVDIDDDEPDIGLGLGEDNDEDEEEEEEDDADVNGEAEDEDEENDDAEAEAASNNSDEEEQEDEEEEEEADQAEEVEDSEGDVDDQEEQSAPPSVATRSHKRSASVLSEGSRAGSTRSGTGRKRSRK